MVWPSIATKKASISGHPDYTAAATATTATTTNTTTTLAAAAADMCATSKTITH
jgi:hypothetical protein